MTTFLLQSAVCLVIWLAVGVSLALRVRHTIRPVPEERRGRRALAAVGLYLFSAIVLLSGLLAVVSQHGIQNRALVPWAWFMVGLIGMVFVLMQLRATVLIGSLVIGKNLAEPQATSEVEKEARETSEASQK